jgi:RNA polymerase sigma factor (sigma-70 family)
MSSAQVGAVLRHIRRLAAARHDDSVPDRELLERFARQHDGDAFAALLRRHGPMVLGVCRSVLRNLHDAEDAFQAAFLLLAKKAGSIHRREPVSVSGWLYRVAYHLAVRSQATAARRRILERRAVTMPPADPVLDLSLREVRAVLLEELEGLPEQYRAPLVLCGLEEKSREEAARLLGWSRGAVKGKLERGRELLRARLRRRGLELPAALAAAALALGSGSGKVSATLVASTLRAVLAMAAGGGAAAGGVSAEVAALVEGASKTMFSGKAKIATVLLLAVSAAAGAFGVLWHRAAAADPPAPAQTQADKPQTREDRPSPGTQPKPGADAAIEVRGQVLDPEGKPVPGAKLYLAGSGPGGPGPFPQATSGPDGRFRLAVPKSRLETAAADKSPPQVMAVAEGLGCDWLTVGSAEKELTLRLVQDVPINGHILDPDGKPVAGARLTVTAAFSPKGDDLGTYLEAVRKGEEYKYAFAKSWVGPLPGRPAVLTTGADGRAKLAGVGRERVVHLHLEGPAIATADLAVMTRAAERVGRLHGASFDYLAVASRPIRGVVRDKATGKPLAGVSVGAGSPSTRAVTDQEGRYELLGLPKTPSYGLAVKPPDGLYFERRAELKDTGGLDPLTGDIDMVRGEVTVRGKVTDEATGKPVAKARVYYYPLYANPYVNRKLDGFWYPRSETTTGPDGSYALTVLPGQGELGVTGPNPDAYMAALVTPKEIKEFFKAPVFANQLDRAIGGNAASFIQEQPHALVLLEPGEKDEALVKDVALEPAKFLTVKGRVVGPDGKPLTGVTVRGLIGGFDERTLTGDDFTVERIDPRVNRQLAFYREDKKLGLFLKELDVKAPEPLIVKLQPCGSASGRLVDPDGLPLAGVRIDVAAVAPGPVAPRNQWVTTDKEGRFRFETLVPGYAYPLTQINVPNILAEVVVEPGKTKDVGDVKLVK